MIPLVYHPGYSITAFGLERLHPSDSRKDRRIHDALIARGLRKPCDFVRPRPVRPPDLERVHTPEYLRSLRGDWPTARGHRRPGMRRGVLPDEAEREAGRLDAEVQKRLTVRP
jgi:acetoin utilization deacetylase AcuC-like enzyme